MRILILVNFLLFLTACATPPTWVDVEPVPTRSLPTSVLPGSPTSGAMLTQPFTPTPQALDTPVATPTEQVFRIVNSSTCDWEFPISLTDFSFGGRLLLKTPNSNNYEFWEITNETKQIRSIGVITSTIGVNLRLSPDGKWVLSTLTWNPLENELPHDPIVVASDLSHTFTLRWNQEWDITLGWWDNSKIIVLPANGRTNEIVLLDVFSQSTSAFAPVEGSLNRVYGNTFWSPWREKDGGTVFFNHAFSQVVFFDQIGSLALASLFEHQPLWAYPQLGAFFSDNQSLALWSSDDEYVAFPAWHGRFQNIHLLSKTGLFRQITDFSTLGKPDMFVRLMDWSPDGTKLAFVARSSDDTDTSSLLFVLDLMQQEIRELCVRVADVNWSPDSRYLSVVAMNESFSNQSQLIVIDANSGEKWRVGENREALDIIGWSQVSTNTPR